MTARIPCLAAAALLIGSGSAFAQIKDAVELLPAQTVACLELRQPARLSREIAALVKGSALEDIPRRLAKKRAENQDENGFRYSPQAAMLGGLGMFLGPEMLEEGARIRGGFVAITGFTKDGTPEVVGVLQSGTSNFPGMYMRAFLSFARPRLVGEVEGVPLYRDVTYVFRGQPNAAGAPPQPEWRENGPVMGQLPGLLLFGSSVDSLKGVIRRAKSKSGEASLTNLRAFKDTAALRDRPGLFAYVDVAALQAKLTELAGRENVETRSWIAGLQSILGDRSLGTMTFSLTLHNGTLEGQTRFRLDGTGDSPLLGLLPDRAAQRELLHFAPNDALLTLTGGFGDNEKRWKTFLALLDTLYQLRGAGDIDRPSRRIAEMEKQLSFGIAKDVLAEVNAVGLVIPKDGQRKPDQWTLLLRATDAEAAAKLEKKGLPCLFSLGDEQVRPVNEEECRGRRLRILAEKLGAQRSPFPVCYGREGAILVIGADRERVAEALITGAKKEGLLGEAKVAAAIKDIDDKATAIGVLSSGRALLDLMAAFSRPRIIMKAPGPGQAPVPFDPGPEKSLEPTKAMKALFQAEEPLVFTLNRQPDSLVLEMRSLALRRFAPRLLDAWIDLLLRPTDDGSGAGFGGKSDVIAPKK